MGKRGNMKTNIFRLMGGVLLIAFLTVGIAGCKSETYHATEVNTSTDKNVTQLAYLDDRSKQIDLAWAVTRLVYDNQEYRYDSEIDPDGDRWNPVMYKAILKRAEAKKKGVILPYAKGDCEDTMFAAAELLYYNGFPADQMYLTYCHVPVDQAGNTGGHAILIVLIEGMVPYTIEQLPEPRPLYQLVEKEGYKIIALCRYDEDIKEGWNFAIADDITKKARTIFRRAEWEAK